MHALPIHCRLCGAKHAFYRSTADFSETALAAFADAFLAGELTAHIKPDPRDEL